MSLISTSQTTALEVVKNLALAPLTDKSLLPTVLPLIVGMVVIELYFGKHSREDLGWNTSVGNSVIWVTTGAVMLMTSTLTKNEKFATYGFIGLGVFMAYLNFYHKWSSTVAFVASSSGIIYSLAYAFVVVVKTGMSFNPTVFKGIIGFVIGVNILFKIVQHFEAPARDDFSLQ